MNMLIGEDIKNIRQEFFELYELLSKKSILTNDVISIGNLALFVDYSFPRYKWLEKKKQIQQFANQGDKNEVNMLLAQHLYDIAIRLEISDNLAFKLKKMTSSYQENKLHYFDMILDPYEFPDWFKRLMAYIPVPTKKELYLKLLERLEGYQTIQERGNQIALAYYVDKLYHEQKRLQLIAELEDVIQDHTENDIAWYLAMNIFSYYYPEMQKRHNVSEKAYALNQLKVYKTLYEAKQLTQFHLFTETMGEKLLSKFQRGT